MFFEPLPEGEKTAAAGLPELPPWSGPPALETGAVLAVEQTVARSANLVLQLPTIRAFRSGCMLDMEVAYRQGRLSEDDWWDLRTSTHGGFHQVRGTPLPRKLLRLGVWALAVSGCGCGLCLQLRSSSSRWNGRSAASG